MSHSSRKSPLIIAMHGWAGDSRCWRPWIESTAALGWRWQCGERGYGGLPPIDPAWPIDSPPNALRVVIGHSLGIHLLAPDVLGQADAVVLLTSFGTFVPPGRAGRRVRAALDGMAIKLGAETEAREMLAKFLTNAAAPEPAALMPPGPERAANLDLARLRQDLDLLSTCEGSPAGFPAKARLLAIEAGRDQIVAPEAREMLRTSLPGADWVLLESAGHALLRSDIIGIVTQWVESHR